MGQASVLIVCPGMFIEIKSEEKDSELDKHRDMFSAI